VKRFWEKPNACVAQSLYAGGHLCSTMVAVARAGVLWDLIGTAQPELRRSFDRIRLALGTAGASESLLTLERIAQADEDQTVRRLASEAKNKVEQHQAGMQNQLKGPAETFLKPKDTAPSHRH